MHRLYCVAELPVTAKVDTKRHLRMVAGEAELFKSTKKDGSVFSRTEVSVYN